MKRALKLSVLIVAALSVQAIKPMTGTRIEQLKGEFGTLVQNYEKKNKPVSEGDHTTFQTAAKAIIKTLRALKADAVAVQFEKQLTDIDAARTLAGAAVKFETVLNGVIKKMEDEFQEKIEKQNFIFQPMPYDTYEANVIKMVDILDRSKQANSIADSEYQRLKKKIDGVRVKIGNMQQFHLIKVMNTVGNQYKAYGDWIKKYTAQTKMNPWPDNWTNNVPQVPGSVAQSIQHIIGASPDTYGAGDKTKELNAALQTLFVGMTYALQQRNLYTEPHNMVDKNAGALGFDRASIVRVKLNLATASLFGKDGNLLPVDDVIKENIAALSGAKFKIPATLLNPIDGLIRNNKEKQTDMQKFLDQVATQQPGGPGQPTMGLGAGKLVWGKPAITGVSAQDAIIRAEKLANSYLDTIENLLTVVYKSDKANSIQDALKEIDSNIDSMGQIVPAVDEAIKKAEKIRDDAYNVGTTRIKQLGTGTTAPTMGTVSVPTVVISSAQEADTLAAKAYNEAEGLLYSIEDTSTTESTAIAQRQKIEGLLTQVKSIQQQHSTKEVTTAISSIDQIIKAANTAIAAKPALEEKEKARVAEQKANELSEQAGQLIEGIKTASVDQAEQIKEQIESKLAEAKTITPPTQSVKLHIVDIGTMVTEATHAIEQKKKVGVVVAPSGQQVTDFVKGLDASLYSVIKNVPTLGSATSVTVLDTIEKVKEALNAVQKKTETLQQTYIDLSQGLNQTQKLDSLAPFVRIERDMEECLAKGAIHYRTNNNLSAQNKASLKADLMLMIESLKKIRGTHYDILTGMKLDGEARTLKERTEAMSTAGLWLFGGDGLFVQIQNLK